MTSKDPTYAARHTARSISAMVGLRVVSYTAVPIALGNLVLAAEESQVVFRPQLTW